MYTSGTVFWINILYFSWNDFPITNQSPDQPLECEGKIAKMSCLAVAQYANFRDVPFESTACVPTNTCDHRFGFALALI